MFSKRKYPLPYYWGDYSHATPLTMSHGAPLCCVQVVKITLMEQHLFWSAKSSL